MMGGPWEAFFADDPPVEINVIAPIVERVAIASYASHIEGQLVLCLGRTGMPCQFKSAEFDRLRKNTRE